MLSDVKRIVEEGHLGVRTYEQFVQACLQRAAAGDPEGVALFVFAKLVQPFSEYYFDQALTEGEAVKFRNELLSTISSYEEASTVEERQAVLRAAIVRNLEEGAA